MKLKTFLLSTCVLCSLSTIGFSVTVSRDEFKGYVDNHKKLIERVKHAAPQGGIDEYAQYQKEFLFHTKEYATLKLSNGGAVLNDVNSAKKILHIIISTATKHYLTELSIRHDRVGFYTNYIYSIAQALHRLSDAEYAQILALIDSEITRCERSLLIKKQLQILKGVIKAVKEKLIDISLKGEPRQRLATYQEYREKMIAIIVREEARKEAESRLAADRSPSFGSRDEESSSRTSAAAVDLSQYVSQEEHARAQRELEILRRQSGAGGGSRALSEVEQEFERIKALYKEVKDVAIAREEINRLQDGKLRFKVEREFNDYLKEEADAQLAAKFIAFTSELRNVNAGIYSDVRGIDDRQLKEQGKRLIQKIEMLLPPDAQNRIRNYYNELMDVIINVDRIYRSSMESALDEKGVNKIKRAIDSLINQITNYADTVVGAGNAGILKFIRELSAEQARQMELKVLSENKEFYDAVFAGVQSGQERDRFAYLLTIDLRYFFPLKTFKTQANDLRKNIIDLLAHAESRTLRAILYHLYNNGYATKSEESKEMASLYVAKINQLLLEESSLPRSLPAMPREELPLEPTFNEDPRVLTQSDMTARTRYHRLKKEYDEAKHQYDTNDSVVRLNRYKEYMVSYNNSFEKIAKASLETLPEAGIFQAYKRDLLNRKSDLEADGEIVKIIAEKKAKVSSVAVSVREDSVATASSVSDESSAGGGESGGGVVGKVNTSKLAAAFKPKKIEERVVIEGAKSEDMAAAANKLNALFGGGAVAGGIPGGGMPGGTAAKLAAIKAERERLNGLGLSEEEYERQMDLFKSNYGK